MGCVFQCSVETAPWDMSLKQRLQKKKRERTEKREHILKVAAILGQTQKQPCKIHTLIYWIFFFFFITRESVDVEVFAAHGGNQSRWSHEGYAERQSGYFELHLPLGPNYRRRQGRGSVHTMSKAPCGPAAASL